jgi:hypothetical protein
MLQRTATAKTYACEARGEDDDPANLTVTTEMKTEVRLPEDVLSILRGNCTSPAAVAAVLEMAGATWAAPREGQISSSALQLKYFKFYSRVVVPGRPPYCAKIHCGRYYTVAIEGPFTRTHLAKVDAIFRFSDMFFVLVTRLVHTSQVDEQTGLKVLQEACHDFHALYAVLEPRYIVHRCNGECTSIGPGFEGEHDGNRKEYLYNEDIVL